jgi:hypothetical protein
MEKAQKSNQIGADRRQSFRVDDILSLVSRKIDSDEPHLRARILPGFAEDYLIDSTEEPPDETVNPHVWRLLLQIQNRLGLIINKMNLDEHGVARAEPKPVSLSTTGAKFTTRERCIPGEVLEVKIFLPLDPPLWVVVYGKVQRNVRKQEGESQVAVQFLDMDDSVTEVINRYGLKRQRELIRKRKGD